MTSAAESLPCLHDEDLLLFNELLARRYGLHFPATKRDIFASRVRPRLSALNLTSFRDYYYVLQFDGDAAEEHAFIEQVTNNETFFFRENRQFEDLFEHGLDMLPSLNQCAEQIHLLSAGCSTGEEAYTLNVHLLENLYRLRNRQATVDAFDVSADCIARARLGVYGMGALRALDTDTLPRYFRPHGSGDYIFKPYYRRGTAFHVGNLLAGHTFVRPRAYDVVFCRNVLIYFSTDAIVRVVDNLARCLKPGGLLFLGHSESIIGLSAAFEPARVGRSLAYRRIEP